jgi:hypothetical protein
MLAVKRVWVCRLVLLWAQVAIEMLQSGKVEAVVCVQSDPDDRWVRASTAPWPPCGVPPRTQLEPLLSDESVVEGDRVGPASAHACPYRGPHPSRLTYFVPLAFHRPASRPSPWWLALWKTSLR